MTINAHVIECDIDPPDPPDMVGQHWVNIITKCMWFSVGTASVADWIKLNPGENVYTVAVGASSTVNLHLVDMASFCAIAYNICMFNSTEDKWRSLHLFGGKATATTLSNSIFADIGTFIAVDLNFIIIGSDAVMEAVNNEVFPVTVKFRAEII